MYQYPVRLRRVLRLSINPLVRQHPIASPGGKLSSEARLKRNAGDNFR